MNGKLAKKIRKKIPDVLAQLEPQAGEVSNTPYVRVNATGQILLKPGSARKVGQMVKKAVNGKKRGGQ